MDAVTRRLTALGLFFLMVALVARAEAQLPDRDDQSANGIFSGCKAFADGQPIRNPELGTMGNFCSGALHAISGISNLLPPEWRSCTPATSTARQLARVFLQYVEANPQRMHEDYRKLMLEAFHQAWPCK
jgi:hypothetical protein